MDWQKSGASPQRWSGMAIDFKVMFVLHGAVMIQFILGGSLNVTTEAAVQSALIAGAFVVAALVRKQGGWRWRGAGVKQYLGALLTLCLTALFLGAATPLAPPTNPQIFPWYMGGLQIGVFNTLLSLRLARMAQNDFLADCDPDPQPVELANRGAMATGWRLWARRAYSVAFLAIWLEMGGFFYFHGVIFRNGATSPNAIMNAAMMEHGHTVYVTAVDLGRDRLLMIIGMVGIPIVVGVGALLHFVLGIRIFGNKPLFDHPAG